MQYTLFELQQLLIKPSIVLLNMHYKLSIPTSSVDIRLVGVDYVQGELRGFIDCVISPNFLLRIYLHSTHTSTFSYPEAEPYTNNNATTGHMYVHHTSAQGMSLSQVMQFLIRQLITLGGDYSAIGRTQTVTLDPALTINYLTDSQGNYLGDGNGNVIVLH